MNEERIYYPPITTDQFENSIAALYWDYTPYFGEVPEYLYEYPMTCHVPPDIAPLTMELTDITNWVNAAVSYVPPELFEDDTVAPTSHFHLDALWAHVYDNMIEHQPEMVDCNYFQRLFVASDLVTSRFDLKSSEQRWGTTTAIESFFTSSRVTHEEFATLMMDLLVKTIPYTIWNRKQYLASEKRLQPLLATIRDKSKDRFGDSIPASFFDTQPPVFFPPLVSDPILTPDIVDGENTWYSSRDAVGLYMGEQRFTDLSLNIHVAEAAGMIGPVHANDLNDAAATVTHEEIHRQDLYVEIRNRNPETDFEFQMLELITESSSLLLVTNSVSDDDALYNPHDFRDGYRNLALFSRDLIRLDVFTAEEIVRYGTHQLWLDFYNTLCRRLRNIPPYHKDLIYDSLVRNALIPESKANYFRRSMELHANPEVFLPREFMKKLAYTEEPSVTPKATKNHEIYHYFPDASEPSPAFTATVDKYFQAYTATPNKPLSAYRMEHKPSAAAALQKDATTLYDTTGAILASFLNRTLPGYFPSEEDVTVVCNSLMPVWYAEFASPFPTIPAFIDDFTARLESMVEFYHYYSAEIDDASPHESTTIANRALLKLITYAQATKQYPVKRRTT